MDISFLNDVPFVDDARDRAISYSIKLKECHSESAEETCLFNTWEWCHTQFIIFQYVLVLSSKWKHLLGAHHTHCEEGDAPSTIYIYARWDSVKDFGVVLLCYESVEIHVIAAMATTVIQQIVENIYFENTGLMGLYSHQR